MTNEELVALMALVDLVPEHEVLKPAVDQIRSLIARRSYNPTRRAYAVNELRVTGWHAISALDISKDPEIMAMGPQSRHQVMIKLLHDRPDLQKMLVTLREEFTKALRDAAKEG